jgi:hypothetical protein
MSDIFYTKAVIGSDGVIFTPTKVIVGDKEYSLKELHAMHLLYRRARNVMPKGE